MTRVLLVDDHPVVRSGIRQELAGTGMTVDEAGSVDEALQHLRQAPCDLVVLDITLPGRSGLDLLKELRRDRPTLPVLVLSMHPAAQFARRVLSAGAAGYLTKDSPPGELARAIETIRAGERYTSPGAPAPGELQGPQHDRLSDREYQVLRMLAAGRSVSQIASDLSLSIKSVSTYRARVLRKMGLKSNAELMRYALQNNLVD
ncbi:MAG TPA: response regulator transcription factor [Vicinamibacterales bacterium]|nr:response regulator transcription factor [Vicinamibacterales bacterium]